VRSMADHRALFFRYREEAGYTFRQSSIHDQGVKNVLQWENVALALYRPRPVLAGERTDLRLDLCLPLFVPIDTLCIGDDCGIDVPLPGEGEGEATIYRGPATSVLIGDGPVVVGLSPLAVSDLGRAHAMEVAVRDRVLVISLINYAGPPRRFSVESLLACCNGWLLVVDERTETETLEAALARIGNRLEAATLSDTIDNRLVRTVSYEDRNVSLSASLSHLDVSFAERWLDGRPWTSTAFESPRIITVPPGEAKLGDVRLRNEGATPLRLLAAPEGSTYAIYNLYPYSTEYTLIGPEGVIDRRRIGCGRVVVDSVDGAWRSSVLRVKTS